MLLNEGYNKALMLYKCRGDVIHRHMGLLLTIARRIKKYP
jgi:hypothetical protein